MASLSYAQMKAAHPEFFRPAKGERRATPVDDSVTIRHKGKDLTPEEYAAATKPKDHVVKMTSKVIKPGTIV